MFENNNRVDRFAIRKLTVGVASVLIDVCFFRGNVNVVSADPIGGDAQTEQSVKTEKQTKPVVEAGTDGGTEAGSDRDVGAVETEQGQQKDTDAKPVVDEEPAVESDNSGDAEDGASKGKGSDHFGDAKKDENTASSDDKHLITDGNKAKENDDEANEDKKEEHESSDKGDSGDKLADSKIMARLARAPRRVKDPTFPEKYVLHDGYKWITDYIFKGGSQKPVIILVDPYEHKKGDPLINDKPTFEISKPEKQPDDKPKTPDKPKVPDKITVPDIPDVLEPNPAVVTTDEPKEPKGENVDETLTTGVKGQDVTKTKQNNPVKPMAQDIKQPKQPVVQKVSLNSPKATLPQTGERSSILLSVLGGLVALTGLLYLDKDRKNKKA